MKKILLILLLFTSIKAISQTIHKLDSVHLFSWNAGTETWMHNTREILTFDNNGPKETNYLRLNLSNSNWDNYYQYLKEYDEDNNLIENIFQNWDEDTETWNNSYKDSFSYSDDNLINKTYFLYLGNNWVEDESKTYQYNSENLVEELLIKSRDVVADALVNDTKTSYLYEATNLSIKTVQTWLDWANIWENDDRVIYDYQGEELVKETEQGWNISNQVWSMGFRETNYTYNSDGLISESVINLMNNGVVTLPMDKYIYTYPTNQVITTHQKWNSTNEEWRNYAQQIKTFDTEDNLLEHIYQNWDTATNDWRGFLRLVYFWSEVTEAFSLTVEEQFQQVDVSIFPIPAKNNINIHFSEKVNVPSTLYFHDINGKEIFKRNITSDEQKLSLKLPKHNGSLLFLKINNKLGSNNYKILIE